MPTPVGRIVSWRTLAYEFLMWIETLIQHSLKLPCTWQRQEFKDCQGNEGQQFQMLVPWGCEVDMCLEHSDALSKGKRGKHSWSYYITFQNSSPLFHGQCWTRSSCHSPLGVLGMAVPGAACLLAEDNAAISPASFLSLLPVACETWNTSLKDQLNCLSSKHMD